jgi:SAM-dependent methyltransferase
VRKPFAASPSKAIELGLTLAGVKSGDVLYDFGCGKGDVLLYANNKYGIACCGVEIDPLTAAQARQRTAGISSIRIVEDDVANLKRLDQSVDAIIWIHLFPETIRAIQPSLLRGHRVVSVDHEVPQLRGGQRIEYTDGGERRVLFVYVP